MSSAQGKFVDFSFTVNLLPFYIRPVLHFTLFHYNSTCNKEKWLQGNAQKRMEEDSAGKGEHYEEISSSSNGSTYDSKHRNDRNGSS